MERAFKRQYSSGIFKGHFGTSKEQGNEKTEVMNTPKNSRKFSSEVPQFQLPPGAPRASIVPSSISILFKADESNANILKKKYSRPRGSKDESEIEALSAALIGAPRLNLSTSFGSGDTSMENDAPLSYGYQPGLTTLTSTPCVSRLTDIEVKVDINESPIIKLMQDQSNSAASLFEQSKENAYHFMKGDLNSAPTLLEQGKNNACSFINFRCRICYEEETEVEPLISPCRCRGTVGLLHKRCLEKWLQVSQTLKCELCGYAYILRPKSSDEPHSGLSFSQIRPKFNFFREWMQQRIVRRNLTTDIVISLLLTPLTCIGIYFCVMGFMSFLSVETYAWQLPCLIFLAALLSVMLLGWLVLVFRHHMVAYLVHRQYREQSFLDGQRVKALERRWRFSVHARPRGSSVCLSTIASAVSTKSENRDTIRPSSPPMCVSALYAPQNYTFNLDTVDESQEGNEYFQ